MADIAEVKQEYITTDLSYRNLADKFGMSLSKISKAAKAENWPEERKQFRDKCNTKTLNRASNTIAKRRVRVLDAADRLLDKWESCLEKVPDDDVKGVKLLAATLKDIKECSMINSKQDEKEQKLRIRAIEKQLAAQDDNKSHTITVLMQNSEEFAQ